MQIPMPCRFGESADCKGMSLPLDGVSWFYWSSWGMEYTYFFSLPGKWHEKKFYTTFATEQLHEITIPDSLLLDKPIREHGYPLKGSGHACGMNYRDGKTFIDFIMTSHYLAHIKVQCDGAGLYVPGGEVIFPPSWDTEEKRERLFLKTSMKPAKQDKKQCDGQLSLF